MRRFRSALLVPGVKPEWMSRVVEYGVDATVLDLEDSVALAHKERARPLIRAAIGPLKARGQRVVMVRINEPSSGMSEADVAAVVCEGLDAVWVPKVDTPEEIRLVDEALARAERANGLPAGSIAIMPSPETAVAIQRVHEIAIASPRVRAIFGGGVRDGDTNREVGYVWTRSGIEQVYLRSRIVLAARAARIDQIIGGAWVDLRDLEGLRSEARTYRELGYTGYLALHPTQIPVINAVFTPTAEEIAQARAIIEAVEAATRTGMGAVQLEGRIVSLSTVPTAKRLLALATEFERA